MSIHSHLPQRPRPGVGEGIPSLPGGEFFISAEALIERVGEDGSVGGGADDGEFTGAISEHGMGTFQHLAEGGDFLREEALVRVLHKCGFPVGGELHLDHAAALIPQEHVLVAGWQPEEAFAAMDAEAELLAVGLPQALWVQRPGIADDGAADVAVGP